MTEATKKLQGKAAEFARLLHDHLPQVRERYGVTYLGVFGSYVRGEDRQGSDLDLLVEFEQAPSMFQFIDLQEYLSDLLGVKVDLVMQRALKPGIGQRILAEVVAV
ncbi:MAG: nucleotidyltransferase family protein [Dehalococcoidia bacterium]